MGEFELKCYNIIRLLYRVVQLAPGTVGFAGGSSFLAILLNTGFDCFFSASRKLLRSELRSRGLASDFSDIDRKIEQMRVKSELDNNQQDNKSRARIAYGFTFGFVGLFAIVLIGGPIYNLCVDDQKVLDVPEIITNFVAQFGTPLGFVLGYYFKGKSDS